VPVSPADDRGIEGVLNVECGLRIDRFYMVSDGCGGGSLRRAQCLVWEGKRTVRFGGHTPRIRPLSGYPRCISLCVVGARGFLPFLAECTIRELCIRSHRGSSCIAVISSSLARMYLAASSRALPILQRRLSF